MDEVDVSAFAGPIIAAAVIVAPGKVIRSLADREARTGQPGQGTGGGGRDAARAQERHTLERAPVTR